MKKFFVSLAALMIVSVANMFAQNSLVATLSHEGEVSVFYGSNALVDAHNAATHGDVITLSSGKFYSPGSITKAITLRGAGMEQDTLKGNTVTEILNNIQIQIPNPIEQELTMEGIYHDSYFSIVPNSIKEEEFMNAKFIKCRFKNFDASTPLINGIFTHCKIIGSFEIDRGDATFVNSYIKDIIYTGSGSTYQYHFINSIIDTSNKSYENKNPSLEYVYNATFENSILIGQMSEKYDYVNHTSEASFCVAVNIGHPYGCFVNCPATNKEVATFEELFKTYRGGEYDDNETFELTDEAKAKYLGKDGSEVGMHGGAYPFTAKTSVPHITKCVVPAESDANGKLNVEIEINGAE